MDEFDELEVPQSECPDLYATLGVSSRLRSNRAACGGFLCTSEKILYILYNTCFLYIYILQLLLGLCAFDGKQGPVTCTTSWRSLRPVPHFPQRTRSQLTCFTIPITHIHVYIQVSRGATVEEVKKAYRKLALQHHPDKNQGDEDAHHRFQWIAKAHAVLTDPYKRKYYELSGACGGYHCNDLTISLKRMVSGAAISGGIEDVDATPEEFMDSFYELFHEMTEGQTIKRVALVPPRLPTSRPARSSHPPNRPSSLTALSQGDAEGHDQEGPQVDAAIPLPQRVLS